MISEGVYPIGAFVKTHGLVSVLAISQASYLLQSLDNFTWTNTKYLLTADLNSSMQYSGFARCICSTLIE